VTARQKPGQAPRRTAPGLLGAIAFRLVLLVAPAVQMPRAADAPAPTPVAAPVSTVNLTALKVNWVVDGVVTGATLALWVLPEFFKSSLAPAEARWYEPPGVDVSVRTALVWSNPAPAAVTSDILVAAVPVGLGLWVFLEANAAGGLRTAAEDLLVITEAMTVAGALTTVTRYTTARIRPYAYYGQGTGVPEDHLSFWSGHTTTAFSAAAAAGYVAQLRGYESWPWIYAVGFTAAGAVSYLRVAGDKHWMTDVVVGAVVGTGIGFLVPWLHRSSPALSLRVVPQPEGLAVAGRF
jgi:membrane-associated phospholipid phosphatase